MSDLRNQGPNPFGASSASMRKVWGKNALKLAKWGLAIFNDSQEVVAPFASRVDAPSPAVEQVAVVENKQPTSLLKALTAHFRGHSQADLLALRPVSGAGTCRWVAVKYSESLREPVGPQEARVTARAALRSAKALGLDTLLLDTDGRGGCWVLVILPQPVPVKQARILADWLAGDHQALGVDETACPFPGCLTGSNESILLPGRHPDRDYWTRVWDGERWLEGAAAIEKILACQGKAVDLAGLIASGFNPASSETGIAKPSDCLDDRNDDLVGKRKPNENSSDIKPQVPLTLDDGVNEFESGELAKLELEPIEFEWSRFSKVKTRVKVWHGECLIYTHDFSLESATARNAFAKAVIASLEAVGNKTLTVHDVENRLLELVTEVCQAAAVTDASSREFENVIGSENPEQDGLYRNSSTGRVQISNFLMVITRDITNNDAGQVKRRYEGAITCGGRKTNFSIAVEIYSDPNKLHSAVHRSAGAKAIIFRKDELSRAVSALSEPASHDVSSDFGWNPEGDAYLTPTLRIDAAGIHPKEPDDPAWVDLGEEEGARHLDLLAPRPGEVEHLKAHFVNELLKLHDPKVTLALLAATSLAVLMRFAGAVNRPALWLIGLTGTGKSFVARLFQSCFGDFPVSEGSRAGNWRSTPLSLQRLGYFFRDALFLIDDFKPEPRRHEGVVTLLQNYADGSGRGRLRSDGSSSVTRPIRGLMVATEEDVPEHSASSVARMVVVRTPSAAKDVIRGARCLRESVRYPALMADFIHFLLSHARTAGFAARVQQERDLQYAEIQGRQNDMRIAGNFALFLAALSEFAEYLGEAWPNQKQDLAAFRSQVRSIRDEMLNTVEEAEESTIFVSCLTELIMNGHQQILHWMPPGLDEKSYQSKPIIGRLVPQTKGRLREFDVSTDLALAAVQEHLRRQNRPPLNISTKALIQQFASKGMLLDSFGEPIKPEASGERTRTVKLGKQTKSVFRIAARLITGDNDVVAAAGTNVFPSLLARAKG
jgi:hypothetical protein